MSSPETHDATQKVVKHIRVVVADDHPIVRSGIIAELDATSDIEVVGEAANGEEALSKASGLSPDVLLLDVNMPGTKALTIMQDLADLKVSPEVLVLTVEEDIECVMAMLKAGATGYLIKSEHPSVIADGVRAVSRGEVWLSKSVLSSLVKYSVGTETAEPVAPVTPREMDVLQLVAQGKYNEQIATTLAVTEGTIKNHITNLYDKLQVHSRAELVAYAWQNGLVDSG